MKYRVAICIVLSSLSFGELLASTEREKISAFNHCFEIASFRYKVSKELLIAIAMTESSLNEKTVNKTLNKDGSVDVGLMQINSFWFPKLKSLGISEADLYDPCTNIGVGAWVLADSISRFGNNWRSVGAYNAGTSKSAKAERKRSQYAQKVYFNYLRIINGQLL